MTTVQPLILIFADDMRQEGEDFACLIREAGDVALTLSQLKRDQLRTGMPFSQFYDQIYNQSDTFLIFQSQGLLDDRFLKSFIYSLLDGVELGEKKVIPVSYRKDHVRFPLLNLYVGFDMTNRERGRKQLQRFLQQRKEISQ